MALHAEDEARFADWLNYFGLTEADLGRRAASDPNALEQLRAGTAPPGTLQKVNAHLRANPTGNPAIDGWR